MSSVSGGPHPNLIGASPASAASFRPISALAKIAGKIADGLSSIFKRMDTQQASFGPQFGVRFASKAAPGTTLNGYRVLGDKAKGVEPGFTALKDWHPTDDDKLQRPGHAFNTAACNWVADQLLTNLGAERPHLLRTLQDAAATLVNAGSLSAAQADMVKDMGNLSNPTALLRCPDKELVRQIAHQALGDIMADRDSWEGASLYQGLKDHLMETQLKFTEKHYIKLDFYEANKLFGKYTLPHDRAKKVKTVHQLFKLESPKSINRGAVNEKLANDLMAAFGMKTQKLDIIQARYADGTPKLLLDSTHIEGFNDFDNKEKASEGKVYIKDGVLVSNPPVTYMEKSSDPNQPGIARTHFPGPPKLHTGMQNLGQNKVFLLLLADRDALGSKGGNKGYVGDQFFAIDPGHALKEKLLIKRGDVHSDLSFDPASRRPDQDYKNFSIFDQSTFAEKMQGVRQLQQLNGSDEKIFDDFAQIYNKENNGEALDFAEQLLQTKQQYIGRRDDILQTFASRLAVDNYDFGLAADADPALQSEYRDATLNLLDGLEKLTSTTVGTAKGEKDGVRLAIPQILKPADRKVWDVRQNGSNIEFTFNGKPAEVEKMLKTLNDFNESKKPLPSPSVTRNGAGGIIVNVPCKHMLQTQAVLSYDSIRNFKHG